jgi:hypothetical protein
MRRKHARTRFSVGELVDAAYDEAGRLTRNPRLVAVLVSKVLEEMLSASDRPDLVDQFRKAGS